MTDGFVWLEFPLTGGKQRIAARAVPAWIESGWRPCDPPEAPNLALADYVPAPVPVSAPVAAPRVHRTTGNRESVRD